MLVIILQEINTIIKRQVKEKIISIRKLDQNAQEQMRLKYWEQGRVEI